MGLFLSRKKKEYLLGLFQVFFIVVELFRRFETIKARRIRFIDIHIGLKCSPAHGSSSPRNTITAICAIMIIHFVYHPFAIISIIMLVSIAKKKERPVITPSAPFERDREGLLFTLLILTIEISIEFL